MPEIICQCDNCDIEATIAYCDKCIDEIKDEEYERGKKDGKESAESEVKDGDEE